MTRASKKLDNLLAAYEQNKMLDVVIDMTLNAIAKILIKELGSARLVQLVEENEAPGAAMLGDTLWNLYEDCAEMSGDEYELYLKWAKKQDDYALCYAAAEIDEAASEFRSWDAMQKLREIFDQTAPKRLKKQMEALD